MKYEQQLINYIILSDKSHSLFLDECCVRVINYLLMDLIKKILNHLKSIKEKGDDW